MLSDLILETTRAVILAGLLYFLWREGRKLSRHGWSLILGGFGLLLFGSLLDITDNFESLNRFVVVGDTPVQAILEKLVGFLGGFLLLAIGLIRWIPTVVSQEQREETERRLQYRADFERIVTTISSDLARRRPDEIDEAIRRALETIGRFAEIDRSYVFLVSEDGKTTDNAYEWCAPGIAPRIKNISIDEEWPWFARAMRNFQDVHIPSVRDMPTEAAAEQAYFKTLWIQSVVAVPMISGNSLRGFLGFDSVRSEKAWPDEIIRLMRVVGELFVSALERASVETALRDSERRYRLLAENSGDVIWTSDLEFNWGYVSPSFEYLTGFSSDEAMELAIDEMLTPASAEVAMRVLGEPMKAAAENPDILHELIRV